MCSLVVNTSEGKCPSSRRAELNFLPLETCLSTFSVWILGFGQVTGFEIRVAHACVSLNHKQVVWKPTSLASFTPSGKVVTLDQLSMPGRSYTALGTQAFHDAVHSVGFQPLKSHSYRVASGVGVGYLS